VMVLGLLAVVAQLADLVTFLWAVARYPALLPYEVGPIATAYQALGPLGAAAFKVAGVSFVLGMAAIVARSTARTRHGAPVLVAVVLIVGLAGAFFNLFAVRLIEEALHG
jgi:Co/Zn/Cd efflux system component